MWYCECSGLYRSKQRTGKIWQLAHRFLQTRFSRLFLTGYVEWINPYLDFENNIVQPGPGPRTQLALLFNVYRGPTKVYLADDLSDKQRTELLRRHREDKQRGNTQRNSSSKKNGGGNDNSDVRAHRSFEIGATEVSSRRLPSQSSSKRQRQQQSTSSSAVSAMKRSGGETGTIQNNLTSLSETVPAAGYYYEWNLRLRLCTSWVFLNTIVTAIVATLAGTTEVDPLSCKRNFFIAFLFSAILFPAALWLRPYIVPWRNAAIVTQETSNLIGACVFAGVLLSESAVEEMRSEISFAQLLCVGVAGVIGPVMMALGLSRIGIMLPGKMKLVTRTALRKQIAREMKEVTLKKIVSKEEETNAVAVASQLL